MGIHRATRFLIDKVDTRLGDVNKEIKFDKSAIAVCVAVIVLEIVFAFLASTSEVFVVLSLIFGFFAITALYILVIMIKELKADQKKKDAALQK